MATMTANQLLEHRRKLRDQNSSKHNQGGPLEKAAIAEDYRARFSVYVRSDGQGGYCYRDPYAKDSRKHGALDPLGNGQVSTFQVDLYQWDKGRAVLATTDKDLMAVEMERDCIMQCRVKQHNDPQTDGVKLHRFIEKSKVTYVNMGVAYRECFKNDASSKNEGAAA